MLSNFFTDLEGAKAAEELTLKAFQRHSPNFTFYDVSANPEYYHKGDILAVGANGVKYYIEVKDDGTIANTHNVLCEHNVYYNDTHSYSNGNMFCKTDLYCVVSRRERCIYVLDFQLLQSLYKQGQPKVISHPEQTTFAYLCSLEMLKEGGALLDILKF